ncbi:hypothetical protein [Nocardia sp. NBC_00511]|uniref:hypothetical protein n=1 Tax=Nocardia sp. NBC_00511 TaxID=2903591 RepID=UPI0030DE30EC
MLSATIQLLSVIAALLLCIAAAWGIGLDRTEYPDAQRNSMVVAGDRRFHRVPVSNTHRRHGRHRAR